MRPGPRPRPPKVLRPPAEGPFYALDPQMYEQNHLSLAAVLALRRCPSCQAGKARGKKGEGADPFGAWAEQANTLREHCSRQEGYITPTTPLLEAVFRLLAASDRALSLQELAEAMAEAYGPEGRDVPPAMLQRALENQRVYGIRVVQGEEKKEASAEP